MPPSASDVADALAGRYGAVSYTLSYSKRDTSFNLIADITAAVLQDPAITGNNYQACFRTLTGLLLNRAALPGSFNFATDNVGVVMSLLVLGTLVAIPLGLFRLSVSVNDYNENGTSYVECAGSDLVVVLMGTTNVPYTVAAGTNYMTAVSTILTAQGLVSTLPVVASTTPLAYTWDAGTTWFQICKDLMDGLGYWPVWPNASGRFTTAPLPADPSTALSDVTFSDSTEPIMIAASQPWRTQIASGQFKNVAQALIDDVRSAAFGYKQTTNADATSGISTAVVPANLLTLNGRSSATVGVPSTKCILDATTAGNLCAFTLRQETGKALLGDLATFRDPRRDAHESYSMAVAGVEAATLWAVESWQMDLNQPPAPMKHKLRRSASVALTVNV